jgi:endonuclease/exonuclease/phosphatase family metal-dependent hydrolase
MTPTARRPARGLVLSAVIGAFALASGVVPGATSYAATRKADPASETIRIASYNAGAMVKVKGSVRDVQGLIDDGVDVIALQEFSSGQKRAAVRADFLDCETCLYDGYMPAEAVPGGQPILYRSDKFTLLDAGMVQVSKDTYVGPRGAGPSTLRAKWITWVRLKTIATNRQIYVLNNHAVPTVQRGDGSPNARLPKRVKLYGQHMAGLQALITQIQSTTGGAIYVVGDLNVNYRTDSVLAPEVFPYANLTAVGMTATYATLGMPEHGTHVLPSGFDKRLIDYGYYQPRRWVTPSAQNILEGFRSDHRPLVMDYMLSNRACFSHHVNVCLPADS